MTAVDRSDNGQDEGELLLRRVDEWYYAEREVCGFATVTEPPCVKSLRHDGDCDGTYDAPWLERFNAWVDHQIAANRAEMELGGPQPDTEVRQHRMDADCWCQPVQADNGAWDHQ